MTTHLRCELFNVISLFTTILKPAYINLNLMSVKNWKEETLFVVICHFQKVI